MDVQVNDKFVTWFSKLKVQKSSTLSSTLSVFKIDDNTVSVNKGKDTAGIIIRREGDTFKICNDFKADEEDKTISVRNNNLKSNLASLYIGLVAEFNPYESKAEPEKKNGVGSVFNNYSLFNNKPNPKPESEQKPEKENCSIQ